MQGYQLAARAVPAFHVHPGLWRDESIWTFTSVGEADESGASRVERLHPAAVRDKVFFAEGGHVFQLNLQPLISDLLQLSSSHLIITHIILSSKKLRRVEKKAFSAFSFLAVKMNWDISRLELWEILLWEVCDTFLKNAYFHYRQHEPCLVANEVKINKKNQEAWLTACRRCRAGAKSAAARSEPRVGENRGAAIQRENTTSSNNSDSNTFQLLAFIC